MMSNLKISLAKSIFLKAASSFMLLHLVISFTTVLHAQTPNTSLPKASWLLEAPYQTDQAFTSISFPTADTGYAQASFDLFCTTNGGLTWKPLPTRLPWYSAYTTFVTTKFGYSWPKGGDTLYLTKNGGKTWTRRRFTPGNVFEKVQFKTASYGIALTNGSAPFFSQVYITTDSGNSWRAYNTPATLGQMKDFDFARDSSLVAINADKVIRSPNAGRTWREDTGSALRGINRLSNVVFNGDSVGHIFRSFGEMYAYRSDSLRWNYRGTIPFYIKWEVALHSLDTGVIISRLGVADSRSSGYYTTNGFRSFTNISFKTTAPLYSICKIPGKNRYIVGGSGGYLAMVENGIATDINPWSALNVESVAQNNTTLGVYERRDLSIMADTGQNWKAISMPINLRNVTYLKISSKSHFILGDQFLDTLHVTSNAGQTWTRRILPVGNPYPISFSDSLNGIICSNISAWSTNNGGRSWQPLPQLPNQGISKLYMVTKRIGYMASNSRIYYTNNGGNTWVLTNLPVITSIIEFSSNSKEHFSITVKNYIHTSLDSGTTWRTVSNHVAINRPPPDVQTNIAWANTHIGFCVSHYNNPYPYQPYLWVTADRGLSWRPFLCESNSAPVQNFPILYVPGKGLYARYPEGYMRRWRASFEAERYINFVTGTIYNEINNNCSIDSVESGIPNQLLQLTPTDLYVSTDANGRYQAPLLADSIHLRQIISDPVADLLRSPICDTAFTLLTQSSQPDTLRNRNFANRILRCPLLQVQVSVPIRRACFVSGAAITYSNRGNTTADSVIVYLKLPQIEYLKSASHPYSFDSATNTYRFLIGSLAAGQERTITWRDSVACQVGFLNRLSCIEAWITPDYTTRGCLRLPPSADGSILMLQTLACTGDTANFLLTNTGTSMASPRQYRIYADSLLSHIDTFFLAGGAHLSVRIPSDSISLIRIEADQHPNYPYESTAIALGACLPDSLLGIPGPLPGRPGSTTRPWFASIQSIGRVSECRQITGAYDPNDKLVLPVGQGPLGYTPHNTRLNYTLRFQNTGSDTAFNITVIDTLSPSLDVSTLQLGPTSHATRFSLEGRGRPLLRFTMPNILLPDSARNLVGSNGFVSFSIKPMPLSSQSNDSISVRNNAAIYFDFNPPIFTNTTLNTFYTPRIRPTPLDTVLLKLLTPKQIMAQYVTIYPNPAQNQITLIYGKNKDGSKMAKPIPAMVYNTRGQLVATLKLTLGEPYNMPTTQFARGIYVLRIANTSNRFVLN
jgi:photosystem II stability/assembly factor-like uncharacterized protein